MKMNKQQLYIGQCELGSTSRMRYSVLSQLINGPIRLVDITPIIQETWKPFRSIGWRYKVGPLIQNINTQIQKELDKEFNYEFIWIDKGVFIQPKILKALRKRTKRLIHFTPDPAFLYHSSKLFEAGIDLYDYCVTTKSFELNKYKEKGAKNTIFCTQGFDENVHRQMVKFEEKIYDVCFIGHYESERAQIIKSLINKDYSVVIAGINWLKFYSKHKNYSNLTYLGNQILGDEYVRVIGQSKIGLGLISKWIPEKHTTRTFEIPACGTALLTESNVEIRAFYDEGSALFFSNFQEIPEIIAASIQNNETLRKITSEGYRSVTSGSFSYQKILQQLLREMNISR
jgi:spore maturation protein CgeB